MMERRIIEYINDLIAYQKLCNSAIFFSLFLTFFWCSAYFHVSPFLSLVSKVYVRLNIQINFDQRV